MIIWYIIFIVTIIDKIDKIETENHYFNLNEHNKKYTYLNTIYLEYKIYILM